MDSSIMKFLEEDEDESLHSGADLDAYTAALNRDIDGGVLSQGNCHASNQFIQWRTSTSHGQNTMSQSLQDSRDMLRKEQSSSEMMLKQRSPNAYQPPQIEKIFRPVKVQNSGKDTVHIQEQNRTQNPESKHQNIQSVDTQQSSSVAMSGQLLISTGITGQQMMTTGLNSQKGAVRFTGSQLMITVPNTGVQLPIEVLFPLIQPQLDKDKGMQLQTLHHKFKRNELSNDDFSNHLRTLIGDHMLKMAIYKFQTQACRNTETGPSKLPMQSQASAKQYQQTPSNELQGTPEGPVQNQQGYSKQQQNQQHFQFSQASFPTYLNMGNKNHTHSVTNSSSTPAVIKPQDRGLLNLSICARQGIGATQLGDETQTKKMLNASNAERKSSLGEPNRTVTYMTSNSMTQRSSVQWQSSTSKEQRNVLPLPIMNLKSEPVDHSPSFSVQGGSNVRIIKDEPIELQSSRIEFSTSGSDGPSNFRSTPMPAQVDTSSLFKPTKPVVTSPVKHGKNGKIPPKNPSTGQKRPLETVSSLHPPLSKKLKASGDILGQSIEELNDVTAVSGVNLREEEEQLFAGPKVDGKVSEASLRAVQEEEKRLILQKIPLQKKLTEIMRGCGLKSKSSDVERCLSLCVEERMRVLITTLIRFSKQRADIEKLRQRTIVTSDVGKQIMVINERAREEWEKQQAEISEDNAEESDDKEKDGHAKSVKANKGEDEKMRATAANVAARAALGGDDMLSKWQLMAEQAKQKHKGSGINAASDSQSGKEVQTSTRNTKDQQESEKGSESIAIHKPGAVRKVGRNQIVVPRNARSITIKDVLAVLEAEPQMSKSTLVYRLYEKIRINASSN